MRRFFVSAAIPAALVMAGCAPTGGGPVYEYRAPDFMIPADVVESAFQAGVGPEAVVIRVTPGSEGFCWFYETPSGGYASLNKCVG